jgi:hypothetical protein
MIISPPRLSCQSNSKISAGRGGRRFIGKGLEEKIQKIPGVSAKSPRPNKIFLTFFGANVIIPKNNLSAESYENLY